MSGLMASTGHSAMHSFRMNDEHVLAFVKTVYWADLDTVCVLTTNTAQRALACAPSAVSDTIGTEVTKHEQRR